MNWEIESRGHVFVEAFESICWCYLWAGIRACWTSTRMTCRWKSAA